jgi:hypothetical protein
MYNERKNKYKTTRKTFDFEQYSDVLDFLEKQPNMTKYIVDLVRKDMNKEVTLNKEEIFAIIEEYLQTRNITFVDNSHKSEMSVDDEKMKQAALKIIKQV